MISRAEGTVRPALRLVPGRGEGEQPPSDEQVLEAVQRGEHRVAGLLYDRLFGVVDHTLFRVFGRREVDHDDLVQTVYAVSRDDLERYAHPVDARSSAVKTMIALAVAKFREKNLEIGICGQAPSDFPDEVPPFLVECGITSISVTPDTVLRVRAAVLAAEKRLEKAPAGQPIRA